MFKKATALVLALALITGTARVGFAASAAPHGAQQAAESLHHLGLFAGMGANADGSPMFALERRATRAEAIVMFVRLIGGAQEAHSRQWDTPFTDVPSWAAPYVGYAWHYGLTVGMSPAQFGSHEHVTAAQYITFVLRALGYVSDVDFRWSSAWILSDSLGITDGRHNAGTNSSFFRGDLAQVSFNALKGVFVGTGATLAETLVRDGVFTQAQAQAVGLHVGEAGQGGVAGGPGFPTAPAPAPQPAPHPAATPAPGTAGPAPAPPQEPNAPTPPPASQQTPSSMTLPNRRMTDAERQAWIADYRAHGGATTNEMEVMRLVNAERRGRGLVEVEFDDALFMAARYFAQQANDLRGMYTGTHNFGPYADVPTAQHGASANVARAFGANLRWNGGNWHSGGTAAAQALVSGWMASDGHRDYILSPEHRFIGVGQFPGGISYMFLAPQASGGGGQAGQGGQPVSITLSHTALSLNIGQTQGVSATVMPADAANRTVTWTSSDTRVAIVSATGFVTARAAGTSTITARTGNGLTATVSLTVGAVQPTSVSISPATITLNAPGQGQNLTAIVQPATASDRRVTWASSNEAVATVNASGRVTAVGSGTATITATASNGLTATATATVGGVMPSSVHLAPETLSLGVGQTQSLTATFLPANATNRTLTWTSSNTAIATVSPGGAVTARAAGTAVITATTANGHFAISTVTVGGSPPASVAIAPETLSLAVGQSQVLTAIVLPETAPNRTVTWTSNSQAVATVAADGTVTGRSAGTAVIIATTSNGLVATAAVTVGAQAVAPTGIAISPDSAALDTGQSVAVTAVIQPANAPQTATWSSTNAAVAVVSGNGVAATVTALSAGSAYIIATTTNGLTSLMQVSVAAPEILPVAVSISPPSAELAVGETTGLSAVITPHDATNQTVIWTSSAPHIASVGPDGTVAGLGEGSAVIVATTSNGRTAFANIAVAAPVVMPDSISLHPGDITLEVGGDALIVPTLAPAGAANPGIAWQSTAPGIVSVSQDGRIVALSPGTAVIIATTSNGHAGMANVTVLAAP